MTAIRNGLLLQDFIEERPEYREHPALVALQRNEVFCALRGERFIDTSQGSLEVTFSHEEKGRVEILFDEFWTQVVFNTCHSSGCTLRDCKTMKLVKSNDPETLTFFIKNLKFGT